MDAQVIFLGPSAPRDEFARLVPGATILPPAARGDLYRVRDAGADAILLVDGVFHQRLAVSPREVVDVARDGAAVLGAASMGALRAAECWPVGVVGVGAICRLYRRGWLDSDDEVAVATDPGDGFAALSVALINVRYAMRHAVRQGVLDLDRANRVVDVARQHYFSDRQWKTILDQAELGERAKAIERFSRSFDLKRRDALLAARVMARLRPDSGAGSARRRIGETRLGEPRLGPDERYAGHDHRFGVPEAELAPTLVRWLFGTGRYQRYVWALVASEPELQAVCQTGVEERPGARRVALAQILSRRLERIDDLIREVWTELEFLHELDAELMRWYATQTLGRRGPEPDEHTLDRARQSIAIAHGLDDWAMLQDEVAGDRLFGAIPMEWIETAILDSARAQGSRRGELRRGA